MIYNNIENDIKKLKYFSHKEKCVECDQIDYESSSQNIVKLMDSYDYDKNKCP